MLQRIIKNKLEEEIHNIEIMEKELKENVKSPETDWIMQKNAMEQYVEKIEKQIR